VSVAATGELEPDYHPRSVYHEWRQEIVKRTFTARPICTMIGSERIHRTRFFRASCRIWTQVGYTMARLVLSLLGPFQLTLDGVPVPAPLWAKTQALLAYLAAEADRWGPETVAHRREVLAGLLWPDQPDEAARHSLRQALLQLRQALGAEAARLLLVTPQTVQFNLAGDSSVDVEPCPVEPPRPGAVSTAGRLCRRVHAGGGRGGVCEGRTADSGCRRRLEWDRVAARQAPAAKPGHRCRRPPGDV
jgi:hypothetical protein